MIRILTIALMTFISVALTCADAQRRITPAQPKGPDRDRTTENRVNLDRMAHYHDENGNTVLVDTVTGVEWIDSTAMKSIPKMQYPLVHSLSFGLDLWDGAMRIFGQKYGIAGVSALFSMHNRYIAIAEFGLGTAADSPSGSNFTFRSPVAPYFKIGADYNIFYNNSPDYQLRAGLRYGISPFKWEATNVTVDDGYWDDPARFNIPLHSALAGWMEVVMSIKVKITGPISLGWSFKFHKLLHESSTDYGKSMIIPGYGKRSSAITGSFSIFYTLELNKKTVPDVITEE